MNLRDRVTIAGVGETDYVRRSPRGFRELQLEAVDKALADAGIGPDEVDCIITEGLVMPNLFPHDEMAAHLGIERMFDATISCPGPGFAVTPLLAAQAIASGQAKVVLSYFGVNWGSNPESTYKYYDVYHSVKFFEEPFGCLAAPLYFALIARRAMHEHRLTPRQLASVAVTMRAHALLNGRAQMNKPLTYGDYESMPMVAEPLRVGDCSLITDGAAAFVITSAERAKDCPKPPVYVMGAGYSSHWMALSSIHTQNPDYLKIPAAAPATERALRMAEINLADVDFAEVYDCFTLTALMQLESIGFVKPGEAGPFFEEGHAGVKGGSLPVNTHGGLLSHGYLLGINHVVEAVRQLRGEAGVAQLQNAEIGLVGLGGPGGPDYGTLILRKA